LQIASSSGLRPGTAAVIAIRPHAIELASDRPDAPAEADVNVLRATVLRASYLGDAIDYQVRLDEGDAILRVQAATAHRGRAGDRVTLRISPGACVLVPETDR